MKKKIIFIAPGNSSHSFKWISKIQEQNDFDIFWLSFYGFTSDIKNIEKNYFPKTFKGILNCISFIKDHKDAILHIHSIGFHSKFYLIAAFLGIKNEIISTPWGSDLIFGKESILKRQLLKFILYRSKLVTCDALFIKNIVNDLVRKIDVYIINFGIDINRFNFIERHYKKHQKLKILSNRSLEEVYNVESIIKSAKILKDKNINFRLNIYADGTLKQNLQKLVIELALSDCIEFCGKYTQENLVDILERHHVYVSMSHSDAGIASSTAEAMSTGLICCISDVAENDYWIKNNITGYLIEDDNHEQLADKIEEIYEQGSYLQEMSKNARNKIKEDNSIDGEMLKMGKLYKKLGKDIV